MGPTGWLPEPFCPGSCEVRVAPLTKRVPTFIHPASRTLLVEQPHVPPVLGPDPPQDRAGDGDLTCPGSEAAPPAQLLPARRCGPNPPGLDIRRPLGTRAL